MGSGDYYKLPINKLPLKYSKAIMGYWFNVIYVQWSKIKLILKPIIFYWSLTIIIICSKSTHALNIYTQGLLYISRVVTHNVSIISLIIRTCGNLP